MDIQVLLIQSQIHIAECDQESATKLVWCKTAALPSAASPARLLRSMVRDSKCIVLVQALPEIKDTPRPRGGVYLQFRRTPVLGYLARKIPPYSPGPP